MKSQMKVVGPKNELVKTVISRFGENSRQLIRPVNGHRGTFMIVTPRKMKIHFDTFPTICKPGVTIITTSNFDQIKTMKPWRAKKNGEPYGSEWVALRDNNGKKKYFKVESLAEEVFGERWQEVKNLIKIKASKEALGDLF